MTTTYKTKCPSPVCRAQLTIEVPEIDELTERTKGTLDRLMALANASERFVRNSDVTGLLAIRKELAAANAHIRELNPNWGAPLPAAFVEHIQREVEKSCTCSECKATVTP